MLISWSDIIVHWWQTISAICKQAIWSTRSVSSTATFPSLQPAWEDFLQF